MTIFFYNVDEEYGFLSNFSNHSFFSDGVRWKTSEHYYQAQKFKDQNIINRIIQAKTPLDAAIIAHGNEEHVVDNWNEIKIKKMHKAIYLKFSQNNEIRNKLICTGNELLVENSWDDFFWGCGLTKMGRNELGVVLMLYRDIGVYISDNYYAYLLGCEL